MVDGSGNIVGVEPDPDFGNDSLGEPRGIYKMAGPDGVRVLAGIGWLWLVPYIKPSFAKFYEDVK